MTGDRIAGETGEDPGESGLGASDEVTYPELLQAEQKSPLPVPVVGTANLPLGELDPEVLERLAAEMIKRQQNAGAHFYGRRGQTQYGLDVLEREMAGTNSVYQVRRYEVLTPAKITSAVEEYADPEAPTRGPSKGVKPPRRFAARRYVLFTSAEFETETTLQDRLEELQAQYEGDLVIEVWGREMISSKLRDRGSLVYSVFGAEWARVFCGFAPPPSDPADPVALGLVENPVQVIPVLKNLGALAEDAKARETSDTAESVRLYGILADALDQAGFPSHAARQRRHQARLLKEKGDNGTAFAVLWDLARDHFASGAASSLGSVQPDLDQLRPDLDELQTAKLDVLSAAQAWYSQGCLLPAAVPALETVTARRDPDAAFLVCILLEQAVVDGWYDYDPPRSLVTPPGVTPDLLARLRQCASGQSCADVTIRARLACALADSGLSSGSSAADVRAEYDGLLGEASAGRYLHAGATILARGARAFAVHGDSDRAVNLWRSGILMASESRLYGDVLGCRRALNAAILEHPVPAFSEIDLPGPLPNGDRLLAPDQSAELSALRAAHNGKLPDAFGVTRRDWWESRLSGHLQDERDAVELLGDVLLAAGYAPVAVIAWVMAGASGKAAGTAGQLSEPVQVEDWARCPVRSCQAAAAQVIGAQAPLYGPVAESVVDMLLGLTGDLWTAPRVAPTPALDAVNALCRFGISLPASAVDPVLELLRPVLGSGTALIPEAASLLIQLYWAVPERREDLALVIGAQATLPDPSPGLWERIANLPEQARGPLEATVTAQADAGSAEALRTLATWHKPTPALQLAARRTCADLLRQHAGAPASAWSVTTQFQDAAVLAALLTDAPSPDNADPHDLRPGAGPVIPYKILMSMAVGPAPQPADAAPGSRSDPGITDDGGPPATVDASADGGQKPERGNPGEAAATSSWEPDAASLAAAAPPVEVATAVADHLVAVAESSNPPAFVRANALAALLPLQPHLPAQVNVRHAETLAMIAADPRLNEFDEWEIATGDPLSLGKLKLGAKEFPALAMVLAANAAADVARRDTEEGIVPPGAWPGMIVQAMGLLRASDPDTATYGAVVLVLADRHGPGVPGNASLLAGHPDKDVRAVAAGRAILDPAAQRVLMTDPSPQVRANLAGRASELDPEVVAVLNSDQHPDVQRALAGAAGK
jgi:hypothetical protein